MASKNLGTLTLDLVARTAGFVQGMDAAERKSAKKDLSEAGEAAKKGLAFVAGAAVAGGAALTTMVVQSAAAAREIKQLSAVAGTSATDFQTAAYGASLYGNEQEKLADILKDTQDKIGDFIQTGGGPLADFFENIAPRVGVTADAFRELSGRDALQLYVDSLERANLSQSDMTFYMEAIASDSAKLLPLLSNNGKLFDELGKKAEAAGLILSDMDFAALEGAQKTIDNIALQWKGFTNILTVEAAPVLTGIANLFLDIVKDAGGARDAAHDFMNGVVDGAAFAADAVEGVRRTFAVAGRFIAVFALSAQDAMLTLAQMIIDAPTKAVNGLISVLNLLPKVDIDQFGMSDLSQEIEYQIQTARGAVQEGWSDIHDVLMEPMPSESIQKYVATARAASNNVTATVVKNNAIMAASNKDTYQSLLGELDETQAAYNQYYEMVNRIGAANISMAEKTKLIDLAYQDLQETIGDESFWEEWLNGARDALSSFENLSKTVIDSFTSSFGNAFEAMILDSQSLDEALRGIAETMLRSVVNAIGQMVAQWIAAAAVNAVIGSSATAASVTEAGITATAWAPAAALASLATLGGNSVPAAASLTSTTALASTLALTGMAHDGIDSVPQTGTWLLEKGERVMTAQTSAKLDSKLNDIGGGATVNIYNAPAGTTTQQRTDDAGQVIIDVILADINSGGPIISGITRSTGTTRRGY